MYIYIVRVSVAAIEALPVAKGMYERPLPGRWSLSVWFRIVCSRVGVIKGGGMLPWARSLLLSGLALERSLLGKEVNSVLT